MFRTVANICVSFFLGICLKANDLTDDLSFYASFDKGFSPDFSLGSNRTEVTKGASQIKAMRGNGMYLTKSFNYAASGNLEYSGGQFHSGFVFRKRRRRKM